MSASTARPEMMFYGDDHQYMCCWCHCCHSKTACLIVAIIGFAFSILALVGGGIGYEASGAQFWVNLITQILVVLVYACLLYACYTEKPIFVLPALVLQAVTVFIYVLGAIGLALYLAIGGVEAARDFIHLTDTDVKLTDEESLGVAWSSLVPLLLQALVGFGILILIWRFYKYCRDKKAFVENYQFRATPATYGTEQDKPQEAAPAPAPAYYYQA